MQTHSSRLVAGTLLVVTLVVAGCSAGAASAPTGPATPVGQRLDIRTAQPWYACGPVTVTNAAG